MSKMIDTEKLKKEYNKVCSACGHNLSFHGNTNGFCRMCNMIKENLGTDMMSLRFESSCM
jgi:hypothetical protein